GTIGFWRAWHAPFAEGRALTAIAETVKRFQSGAGRRESEASAANQPEAKAKNRGVNRAKWVVHVPQRAITVLRTSLQSAAARSCSDRFRALDWGRTGSLSGLIAAYPGGRAAAARLD